MLRIAGKTAVAIGLTFFVDILEWPGGVKNRNFYLKKFFFNFFLRATAGPSVSIHKGTILDVFTER